MLGLYSNIAIAWMVAVVADLVINKPLGLAPPGIEFKRAHLYDINPVGVGAMGVASLLSIAAFVGLLGRDGAGLRGVRSRWAARCVVSPLIAWATGGRYYMARPPAPVAPQGHCLRSAVDANMRDLRTRVRRRGHGALPGLPGADLLAVLLARRALPRPVQAATPASPAQWNGVLRRLLPAPRPGPTWKPVSATTCC